MSTELVGQIIEGLEPGAMVTRFVLVAESIGLDGERGVWTETHEGATRWDTLGLLAYGMQREQAATIADREADDD